MALNTNKKIEKMRLKHTNKYLIFMAINGPKIYTKNGAIYS